MVTAKSSERRSPISYRLIQGERRGRRARGPHYAKTFAASGDAREMEHIASAYAAGDQATAMTALSDALLDDVLLLGSPSRIREGIARLAEAGVEWITLGPQAVASESLAQAAKRMIAMLAPR